jgi:hypothetical protein
MEFNISDHNMTIWLSAVGYRVELNLCVSFGILDCDIRKVDVVACYRHFDFDLFASTLVA